MNDVAFLKYRFTNWIENLTPSEIERLIQDSQNCAELDRCFRYCNDADCEYFALLLLFRTPTDDFRASVIKWINNIEEVQLRDLLEKGVVCGEQSFCISFCGSVNCHFKRLMNDLCAMSAFQP